jgi:hypothetical protein
MTISPGRFWAALRGKRSTAPTADKGTTTMATKLFQPPHGSPAWFHAMVTRSSHTVISERVLLTPELASELLHNNPDNRFIRNAKMSQYADDIRAGRWTFNGEPILISKEGLVNDGQHRCSAVIETNLPIDTMMIFGLDRASRITVDQGAAKAAADYMSMENIPNATVVASVGRLLLAYERSGGKNFSNSSYISAGEIVTRFRDDIYLARSATFAASMHCYAKKLAPPSIIGFCHCLMSRLDPGVADDYLRQVCIGENIRKSDPAFAAREGLFRERLTRDEKAHLIIRGWNAYRQKRSLSLAKLIGNLPALV